MVLLAKNTRTTADYVIVAHGDSMTAGLTTSDWGAPGGNTKCFAAVLAGSVATAKSKNVNYLQYGISGAGLGPTSHSGFQLPESALPDLTTDAVNRIDQHKNIPGAVLIPFMGGNDIFVYGYSASATAAYMQAYIDARIAAGWDPTKIGVCTPPARNNLSFDAARLTYAADIRSKAVTKGYKVIDLAADATIGPFVAAANTSLFGDGVHPTDYCQTLIAAIAQAVMFP